MPGVELIQGARPTDILKCLDHGAVSVVIFSHAADLEAKNQKTAPLLYFRPLEGADREKFLTQLKKQVSEELAEIQSNTLIETQSKDEVERARLSRLNEKLKNMPADEPVYDQPRIMENQILRRVLSNPENLKKISIIACLPEQVRAYYPELEQLQNKGIEVEFAPINGFMSFFAGKEVVTPDFDWIKRTIESSQVSTRETKAFNRQKIDAGLPTQRLTQEVTGSAQ
jgi:hypothetical protein